MLSIAARTAADSRCTLSLKVTDGHDGTVLVGAALVDHRYGHQLVLRAVDLAEHCVDAPIDLVRRMASHHLVNPDRSNLQYVAQQWARFWSI